MTTEITIVGDTKVTIGTDSEGLYITLTQDEDVIILSPEQVLKIAAMVRSQQS